MDDRRRGERHFISFPIQAEWKNETGEKIVEDGLTENVSPHGALVHLPRHLPGVGSKVKLTVRENPKNPVTVTAQVLRLERNAAHPQAALELVGSNKDWEKHVWAYAGEVIANEKPEEYEDWG